MGGLCSSKTGNENEMDITYERLCAAIEAKLELYNIEITEFETVLDEVSFKKDAIDLNTLSDVFIRFGVTRDEFLSKERPFNAFYSGLSGSIEEDKGYILSMSLPFCKGKLSDKKSVLWRCLMTTEKNYINYKDLLGVIKMLIVMSVKVIPEMVYDTEEKNMDKTLQLLMGATEPQIDTYSRMYFPSAPREGDKMHRHEFDEWLQKPESQGIFSPSHHRKAFITYLNNKVAYIP